MNQTWQTSETCLNGGQANHFSSLDDVMKLEGDLVASDPISQVVKVRIDGKNYYVKRYWEAGKKLRRFFGKSRICNEWENLFLFESLGIAVPKIVAWGEARVFGVFKQGALITEEVVGSSDLEAYVRSNPEIVHDRRWVEMVLRQVAEATFKLHNAGFAHNDLNWRNILVTTDGIPKIYFIDCPSGKKWIQPILKFGILKDLAHLDKVGRQLLTRSQRLRFYKYYLGRSNLTGQDRKAIKFLLDYYLNHRSKKGLD